MSKAKEPTRAQLSSRLTYQSKTPAFLLRMQRGLGGASGDRDDDEYDDDEFEYDGSGRPPIPRRPSIPERPDDEPGSADEDDADEKPQVVVLKEGKHLSGREVENERRKAKGLSPLPEPSANESDPNHAPRKDTQQVETKSSSKPQGLSFSSGATAKGKGTKRKAVGHDKDDLNKLSASLPKPSKKKAKKSEKKLLSFDDDA
ncbi:hypothetical protein C8Q74DRAFT_648108 [Fomes fomentarius]|nr:hypothetical protein C8Q74DRAFT_648108 [Fomes fomentarius]